MEKKELFKRRLIYFKLFLFCFQTRSDLLEAYNIYLYAIIVVGVLGNGVILIVFYKFRPATSNERFITVTVIAVCDLLSSVFNTPIYATFTNGTWVQLFGNNAICQIHMLFSQVIVFTSFFLISGIALDRYIKICRPSSNVLTGTRAQKAIIILIVVFATTCMYAPVIWL